MGRRLVDAVLVGKPVNRPREVVHHQVGDSLIIGSWLRLPNQTATGSRHRNLLDPQYGETHVISRSPSCNRSKSPAGVACAEKHPAEDRSAQELTRGADVADLPIGDIIRNIT